MTTVLLPRRAFVYGDRVLLQQVANKERESATLRCSVPLLNKQIT
jgi:hypothetical protein